MSRRFVTAVVLVGFVFCLVQEAIAIEFKVKHKNRIYWGNPATAENPASLRAKKIFAEIESYKKLKEERVRKDSARYWIYITRANKTFKSQVFKFRKAKGYDLLFEVGALEVVAEEGTEAPRIPEVTKKFIRYMKDPDAKDPEEEKKKDPEPAEPEKAEPPASQPAE